MIIEEKKIRELIYKNEQYIWPAIAWFMINLIQSEIISAIISAVLVFIFHKRHLDGKKPLWIGIVIFLIAVITDNNEFAIATYWIMLAGIASLFIELIQKRE
ncbi:MAG: hypothetical protein ABH983_01070 [Candidatus Micrarchaeota archaeon]